MIDVSASCFFFFLNLHNSCNKPHYSEEKHYLHNVVRTLSYQTIKHHCLHLLNPSHLLSCGEIIPPFSQYKKYRNKKYLSNWTHIVHVQELAFWAESFATSTSLWMKNYKQD